MQATDIERYLHQHIPLSRAMGVQVLAASPDAVRLGAPLAPNINHRETVFGGSASALAILAAWTLLYVRLEDQGVHARVVIQRNSMRYDKPMAATFYAVASAPDAATWKKFTALLARKGRARIALQAAVECDGRTAGVLEGEFVAFRM
jgi:thioesterase domain-containing protein